MAKTNYASPVIEIGVGNASKIPSTKSQTKRTSTAREEHIRRSIQSLIAGTIAGAAEITLTYPIDYTKIQLQLDARSTSPKFNGINHCIKQTVETHGVKGLYRGWNVAVLSPKTVVRFGSYEQMKKVFADQNGNLPHHGKFLCGLGAGMLEAALAVTPVESVKVKFIHDLNYPRQKYAGLFHGVARIMRKQGIKGIYAGLVPTVLKTGTNQAIRFSIVESLKEWNRKGNHKAKVSKPLTAAFGAIGGVVSVFLNTPLDVIKSRMQSLEAQKYRNIFQCAYVITTREGFCGFYKGMTPRLMRVPLETAITFTVYDFVMELLHEVWEPETP